MKQRPVSGLSPRSLLYRVSGKLSWPATTPAPWNSSSPIALLLLLPSSLLLVRKTKLSEKRDDDVKPANLSSRTPPETHGGKSRRKEWENNIQTCGLISFAYGGGKVEWTLARRAKQELWPRRQLWIPLMEGETRRSGATRGKRGNRSRFRQLTKVEGAAVFLLSGRSFRSPRCGGPRGLHGDGV